METKRDTRTQKSERRTLTGAAEALLADSEQHGMAVVTVRWFVEVLQTPNMLPVFLHILGGDNIGMMKHQNCPFSWVGLVFSRISVFVVATNSAENSQINNIYYNKGGQYVPYPCPAGPVKGWW